jgi:ATP-dependent Clp protease protease subunit
VSTRLTQTRLDDDDDEPDAPERPGEPKTEAAPVNELESRLLKGRKVMVFGQINDKLARDVVGRILTLAEETDKPIDIYVNSPGGHVESGDSAGALIYLAGHKKNRVCLPNTRFLLHQPMGGVQGRAVDIDIEAREILKMRERLSQIVAAETGQAIERVRRDTERNYWMSASEAIDYGMVSRIISSIAELD